MQRFFKKFFLIKFSTILICCLVFFVSAKGTDFRYIVEDGDTLASISRKFGESVDDLRKNNNIKDIDDIKTGQDIRIGSYDVRLEEKAQTAKSDHTIDENKKSLAPTVQNPKLSMNVKDADLRDVLYGLSLNMDKNILLMGDSFDVTFSVKDVYPRKALQMLLNLNELTHIEEGNIIIVGDEDILLNEFSSNINLTRFNLKHINAVSLSTAIQDMGINVKSLTFDPNPRAIWVKGVPDAIRNVSDLVLLLDKEENAEPDGHMLYRYELENTTANEFMVLMNQVPIDVEVIMLEKESDLIWVKGSRKDVEEFEALKAQFDIAEASDSSHDIQKHYLSFIDADKMSQLSNQIGIKVQTIVLDNEPRVIWTVGLENDQDEFKGLKEKVDVWESLEETVIFTYELKTTTVENAEKILNDLGFDEVKIVDHNYSEFAREIIIMCPPYQERPIVRALNAMDEDLERISVPIDSARGESDSEVTNILNRRRRLFSDLFEHIALEDFRISENVSLNSDEVYKVIYLTQTPDNINKVRQMVDVIGNP